MESTKVFEMEEDLNGLHEECGVFGIYDFDGGDVASSVYYGLLALQHRGQESCGIAVGDTDGPRKVTTHKGRDWSMKYLPRRFWKECMVILQWDIPVIPRQEAAPERMHSRWSLIILKVLWQLPTMVI